MAFVLRRLLSAVPVLLGILLTTFLIKAAIPTDAVTAMFQGQMTDEDASEAVAQLRAHYHLDESWPRQFQRYVGQLLQGDLGESVRTREPVADEIGWRYLNTIKLTAAALVIAVVLGLGLGLLAAWKRDTWLDLTATSISLLGVSLPSFVFGLMMVLVFSIWLRWVPVLAQDWRALILPALTLGLIEAAPLARVARSAMVDVLGSDFIRAARAKGMSEWALVTRHALPNALVAVVTLVGLQIGSLLGGAFIIEVVFGWPGIGELAVQAIQWRDFAITQAVILVGAVTYVAVNVIVDCLYAVLDPRIELNGS
ncbi:MAG: peptide ABC transporter permease [Methylibium sp.]|nr:peptide ABC transporter permease [Methylibium sp.]